MKGLTLGEVTLAALLQAAALSGAPGLRPAANRMRGPPMLGRMRESEATDAAVANVCVGRGTLVVISGEPGIGKTRLAEDVATKATAAGALVLWGKCWETGGARAFWPWVQVLRQYARSVESHELADTIGAGQACVSLIVPELGAERAELDTSVRGLDSEHARFALFEAVCTLFARASARRPVALFLDDLHAADLPSLLLLQFLANGLRDLPVLVVATHRGAELRRRADAARIIGDLARGAVTLPLAGLGDADVRKLAMELGVDFAADAVPLLQAATDGNPFLIEEVASVLAAALRPGRSPQGENALLLPARGRELIRRRLDLLPESGRACLRIASLIGQEFGLRMLATVAELCENAVLERLREANDDGLIRERSAWWRALSLSSCVDSRGPRRGAGAGGTARPPPRHRHRHRNAQPTRSHPLLG